LHDASYTIAGLSPGENLVEMLSVITESLGQP
jgi:hypothetical protein